MNFEVNNAFVVIKVQLNGTITPERVSAEFEIAHYRADQLSPQPKIEFERDPEDYDE